MADRSIKFWLKFRNQTRTLDAVANHGVCQPQCAITMCFSTASAGVTPASAASGSDLEPGELVPEGAAGGQRAEDGLSADVFAGRFARALRDFAANRDAARHLSVGERESLAVDKWLTKCKITSLTGSVASLLGVVKTSSLSFLKSSVTSL